MEEFPELLSPGAEQAKQYKAIYNSVLQQEQHISAQVILEILNNLEGDKYSVNTKQRGPSRAGEHLEKQR